MRYTVTPAKALQMVQEICAARQKWGKQASPPYSVVQILEAIELLGLAGYFASPPEETAKLRKQLSMAAARETRLRKLLKSQNGDTDHGAEEAECAE